MMRKLVIFSAILFLTIPFFGVHAEYHMGPRIDESEWFSIENIELNVPQNIPEDEFTMRVSTSSRKIEFRHSGGKPVYLPIVDGSEYFEGRWVGGGLQREEHLNNDDIPEKLQYPWAPHIKVVNEEIYFLSRGSEKVGFFSSGGNQWAKIDLFDFFSGELRNVLEYGDNRPDSVKVPDTKTFESKRILYDGQFYRVFATVDFDLNENYNPNAQEAYEDLDEVNMPAVNTKPWWINYLGIIGGELENMWERLF